MNPLQTNPELFCNGKFKADLYQISKIENDIWDIIGVIDGELYLEKKHANPPITQQPAKFCQLIARPIDSLTDEELDQVYPWKSEIRRQILKNRAREGFLNRDPFLKLLELRAYPFDNSHFGDTVIDTRTLKTNEV